MKSYFPFKDMIKTIKASILNLNQIENKNKSTKIDMDIEDYDELRDYQYFDLINVYIQLYLNTKFSTSNREDIANDFINNISIDYIEMLNDFNLKSNFTDSTSFNKSTLRFLLIYMNIFINSLKKYLNIASDINNENISLKSGTFKEFISYVMSPVATQNVK